jgi:Zn-dependent protease with chaperone function
VPFSEASAFLVSSSAGVSVVAAAEGLLNAGLSDQELDAVLAHEIGHIQNRGTGAEMQVVAMIAGFSSLLSVSLQFLDLALSNSLISSRNEDDVEGGGAGAGMLGFAALLAGHMMFGLGTFFAKWVSIRHDFDADEVSIAITGSDALSYALAKSQARGVVGAQQSFTKKKKPRSRTSQ